MARRRYVSTDVSIDKRLNRLAVEHGDFAALLYTWMVPHATDEATLNGDIDEFMATVLPMRRDKTPAEVRAALEAMCAVGLLTAWDGETIYFPTEAFYRYQTYIKVENRRIGDVAMGERTSPTIIEERRETPTIIEGKEKPPCLDSTPENAEEHCSAPENAVSVSIPLPISSSVSVSLSGPARNAGKETPIQTPQKSIVTEEWLQDERELFRERLPASGFWSFDRVFTDRTNQPYFKRAIDKRGYLHGQFENAAEKWAEERTNGNGRNNHNSPNKAAEIAGLAAFE